MKSLYTLSLLMFMALNAMSQSVGIGKTDFTPDPSAALEIQSNEKGLLIPKMFESERNAIANPAIGLLVFQTDNQSGFYYYNGSQWQGLASDFTEVDGDITNEIQVLSISGNILTLSNGGGTIQLPAGVAAQNLSLSANSLSIDNGNTVDLSPYLDNTNLSESEVDLMVGNNGYLTTEVDGSVTNEIQDLQLTGNILKITANGSATSIDLSKYLDNTDTKLTETEVDLMVGNNGYLTTEIDGSVSNEIQDLQLVGNILKITANGSATSIDLSKYLDDTKLTESEVDLMVGNNGYLTTEVDGSVNNEIQDLQLIGNILKITANGSATSIDLSKYLDDTKRTEAEVDAMVGNNGYLTTEIDGSTSNEIQDLQLIGNILKITANGSATSIDLSKYLDDTKLTESEVDLMVGNNGYLTTEVDGSVSNEIQDLQLSGNVLSLTGDDTTVDLSSLKDNLGNHTATEKLQLGANKIGFGTEDKGLNFDSNGNATFTNNVSAAVVTATDVQLGSGSINTDEIAGGAATLSKIEALLDGQIIIGTNGTSAGNAKVQVGGDATLSKTGTLTIANNAVNSVKIADGSVTTDDITNFTIQSTDLADGSVVNAKLADNSVSNAKIQDNTIGSSKILDNAVTAAKLASMSANTDEFLQWNGSSWDPAPVMGTLDFKGTWDPVGNNPALSNTDSGISGQYYVASQSGSVDFGSGNIDFFSGDIALGTSSGWRKISNSNAVNTVYGRTGEITAQVGDYTWNQINKSTSSVNDISDVNSGDLTSGNVLIANGSVWNSKALTGDVSLNSNGVMAISSGSVTEAKLADGAVSNVKIQNNTINFNKLQNATGAANTILVWNGSAWVESLVSNLETDADVSNELQNLNLTNNDLSLSRTGSTVNLAKYFDNTDSQSLSLVGTQLSISGGNNVDLSGFASTDSQELGLTGNTLTLTRSATSVDLSGYQQDLSLNTSTNELSISGGNMVDLDDYKDNTDNQDLVLTGDVLSLTNDATTVDLAKYLDNTDQQNLSITGHNLGITGGNTINLSVADIQDLSLAGDILSLTNDATTVDLSAYKDNTDSQTLSLTGTDLSISGGNTLNVSSLKDNLGNHTATTNIQLSGNYISNDGDAEGININDSGNVGVSNVLFVAEDLYVGGTTGIDGSAILGVGSTTKGFLPPRMTTAQRVAITSPAKGLMVFDNTLNFLFTYDGTSWQAVGGNDNLGNHTATQNIQLNGQHLSNDGDAEGIIVDNSGNVAVSGLIFANSRMLVGGGGLETTAALEIESSTQGFLPPRMTQTEREAISSPAKGLMVFDNTLNSLFTYNGTAWVSAEASATTWNVMGNTTVNETTNFIGSVNAADVVVRTQNTEVMRATVEGTIGVGTGNTVDASALVEMNSTTKGFLPPRMSTTQRNAITNPAIGLVVFDTNKNNLFLYAGMWVEMGVPLGTVEAFYGTTVPEGWLLCNGSTFDAGTYSELNTFLGGNTLPDLGGMFLRGKNNSRSDGNQDPDGERTVGSFQGDELKSHNHNMWSSLSGWNNNGGDSNSSALGMLNNYGGGGVWMHAHPNTATTGGAETRPVNVAVNYIIKAK